MNHEDALMKIKDVVSWTLVKGRSSFDPYTQWEAEFVRYMIGFVTQTEENWFQERVDQYAADMYRPDSRLKNFSKSYTHVLRHTRDKCLFDDAGTVELSKLFDYMGRFNHPIERGMKGADFAAFLYANNKGRFMIHIHLMDLWFPERRPPKGALMVRMGAFQGHSNHTQDPNAVHHPLTMIEAKSLGWIYHTTSTQYQHSILRYGLQTRGRDAIHFMYYNDNGPGYTPMGPGTREPRNYGSETVYFVLNPKYFDVGYLYLTQNGIVLAYQDVPAEYLSCRYQKPVLASNIFNVGQGHVLPREVTFGHDKDRILTYEELRIEKGDNFEPGKGVPEYVRKTAWEFMNSKTPKMYGKLFFTHPLPTQEEYERISKPPKKNVEKIKPKPMPKRTEPQKRSAEEQASSSAGKEFPASSVDAEAADVEMDIQEISDDDDNKDYDQEPDEMFDYQWEEESRPRSESTIDMDETVSEKFLKENYSSNLSGNPWMLYNAGVVCAKDAEGEIILNDYEEKVVALTPYKNLKAHQKIALRQQGITEPEWEELPWTGYYCYFFTMAWQIGREYYVTTKTGDYARANTLRSGLKDRGIDFLEGMIEPVNWQDRFTVKEEEWPELWQLYDRKVKMQADFVDD